MDMDDIKRGLREEIKKRENEQYFTFQTNIRQMCVDVLCKLEEQEQEIADLIEKNKRLAHKDAIMASETIKDLFKELRHQKYKRCLAMAKWCYSMDCKMLDEAADNGTYFKESWCWKRALWYGKWKRKWLELAEKFKEAK